LSENGSREFAMDSEENIDPTERFVTKVCGEMANLSAECVAMQCNASSFEY
jgi:hypothetical protein